MEYFSVGYKILRKWSLWAHHRGSIDHPYGPIDPPHSYLNPRNTLPSNPSPWMQCVFSLDGLRSKHMDRMTHNSTNQHEQVSPPALRTALRGAPPKGVAPTTKEGVIRPPRSGDPYISFHRLPPGAMQRSTTLAHLHHAFYGGLIQGMRWEAHRFMDPSPFMTQEK